MKQIRTAANRQKFRSDSLDMNCLEQHHSSHRKSLRRSSKSKSKDGFRDLMDDTDREVSILTDRAFKSLCVGDEAVYNDSELCGSSPSNGHIPAFGESVGCGVSVGNSSSAATFQHSLVSSVKQEQSFQNKNAPNLKNGTVDNTWLQKRCKLKVSSLKNSFSNPDIDANGSIPMEGHKTKDVLESLKCTQKNTNCEPWDKSALISIQQELSEMTISPYIKNLTAEHKTAYKNQINTSIMQGTHVDLTSPGLKQSKGKSSKSSKNKKVNCKNFFLHSEFSPFQSWRECSKLPFEQEEISNQLSTKDVPQWYDSPVYKELTGEHRLQRTQLNENRSQSSHKDTVPTPPLSSEELDNDLKYPSTGDPKSALAIEKKSTSLKDIQKSASSEERSPSLKDRKEASASEKSRSSADNQHNTYLSENNLSLFNPSNTGSTSSLPKEQENGLQCQRKSDSEGCVPCPPWRRNRNSLAKEAGTLHYLKVTPKEEPSQTGGDLSTLIQVPPAAVELAPSKATPFNITQLLTPAIHTQHEADDILSNSSILSPTDNHLLSPNSDNEIKAAHEVKVRDSYKAMASSLLFNIKDNRKRVKAMYSPPKFTSKDTSDHSKPTGIQESVGHIIVPAIPKSLQTGNSTPASPKAADMESSGSLVPEPNDRKTADCKKRADDHISGDSLTLRSPQTVRAASSCRRFSSELQGTGQLKELSSGRLLSKANRTLSGERLHEELQTTVKRDEENKQMAYISKMSTEQKDTVPICEEISLKGTGFNQFPQPDGKEIKNVNNVSNEHNKPKKELPVDDHEKIKTEIEVPPKPAGVFSPLLRRRDSGEQNVLVRNRTQGMRMETSRSKKGINESREKAGVKEGRAKHLFSARQNQYIKNERYAMVGDDEEHEARMTKGEDGTNEAATHCGRHGTLSPRTDKRKRENKIEDFNSQGKVREKVPAEKETECDKDSSILGEECMMVTKNGSSANDSKLDQNKVFACKKLPQAVAGRLSAQEQRSYTSLDAAQFQETCKELGGVAETDENIQPKRETLSIGRNGQLQAETFTTFNLSDQNVVDISGIAKQSSASVTHDQREVNDITKEEFTSQYIERENASIKEKSDGSGEGACDIKERRSGQETANKPCRGNVRQKVLTYSSESAQVKAEIVREKEQGSGLNVKSKQNVSPEKEIPVTKDTRNCVDETFESDVMEETLLEEKQIVRGEQGATEHKCSTDKQTATNTNTNPTKEFTVKEDKVRKRMAPGVPEYNLALHGNGDTETHSAPVKPVRKSRTSTTSAVDTRALSSLSKLQDKEDKRSKEETEICKIESEQLVLCHATPRSGKESETEERQISLLHKVAYNARNEGNEHLEESSCVRGLIDYGKGQSNPPRSSRSSSPVAKPILFKVKDNTFKNSTVTKTVKPRLHKTFLEESSLCSPRESLSGSEKFEDEHERITSPLGNSKATTTVLLCTLSSSGQEEQKWPRIPDEGESHSVSSAISEEMESHVASTVNTEETTISVFPTDQNNEISDLTGSTNEMQNKPPVVPPKSEKALRRAQKLTNRRIKKAEIDAKTKRKNKTGTPNPESNPMSHVISTTAEQMNPQEPLSSTETPLKHHTEEIQSPPLRGNTQQSLQITQRKVLQDPDSGQYFVVNMPMEIKTKTFFDPEMGSYIQLPIRSPEESISSTTCREVLTAPYMLCHGFVPVPLSSLPSQEPVSQRSSSQASLPSAAGEHGRLNEWAAQTPETNRVSERREAVYIDTPKSLGQQEEESSGSKNKEMFSLKDMRLPLQGEIGDLGLKNS